jgi:hypothetical protein
VSRELNPCDGIRIVAGHAEEAGVDLLVTFAAEQQTIGRGPPPALAAELHVVEVLTAAVLTRATSSLIAPPDGRSHGFDHTDSLDALIAFHDYAGFGFGEAQTTHQTPDDRAVAATVWSAHTRTPGIWVAPLSARTTPPSFF